MCCACRDRIGVRGMSARVVVHAIELMRPNVAWLSWALARFGVPAYLVHAAASNVSGTVLVPVSDEVAGMGAEANMVLGQVAQPSPPVGEIPAVGTLRRHARRVPQASSVRIWSPSTPRGTTASPSRA